MAVVAVGVVATTVAAVGLTGGGGGLAAAAAAPIYGTCTGQTQGVIKSDVTIKAFAGKWVISSISDGIVAPYDAASGQPTGRYQEQGVKVSMAVSPATIGLVTALTRNENLTSCQFDFHRPTATGVLQDYFQIKLTNARLSSYAMQGSTSMGSSNTFSLPRNASSEPGSSGGKTTIEYWAPLA